jgi:hypothetical protein
MLYIQKSVSEKELAYIVEKVFWNVKIKCSNN